MAFSASCSLSIQAVAAAGQDHLQLVLLGEPEGRLDVALRVSKHDDRQALEDPGQRLELQLPLGPAPGSRRRLGVVACRIEPVAQLVLGLLGLLLRFAEGRFANAEGAEIKAARLDGRPADDHREAGVDRHLLDGPAVEMDERPLAQDHAVAPRPRGRERVGDAVRPRHRDDLAGGMDRRGRSQVGVVAAQLGVVDGGGDGVHFNEPHLAQGVEEPRVDVETGHVDACRSIRNHSAGTDAADDAVLDHDRTRGRLAGERVDRAAFQHDGGRVRGLGRQSDRERQNHEVDAGHRTSSRQE